MTVWESAEALRADLRATLDRFLTSSDGAAAAALAQDFDGPAVLELALREPDVVLHVDVAARAIADGPAGDPAARVEIRADDLHDLLLERLGPVEISRLVEEGRLHLVGRPRALAAALVLAGRIQPHYELSLRERQRDALLDTPLPPTGVVWESEEPPPPVFGVRRPWQRPRGAAAPAV
jgi:hypothetical protein